MMGMQILNAGVGFMGAQAQANDVNKAHERARLAALAQMRDSQANTQARAVQQHEADSLKKLQNDVEAAEAEATAYVGALEGGGMGKGVRGVLATYIRQNADRNIALQINSENAALGFKNELEGASQRATAAINNAPTAAQPWLPTYALKAATGVMDVFNQDRIAKLRVTSGPT